jgi:hypothetical protein
MLRRRISGFGKRLTQPRAPRQEKSSVIGSAKAELHPVTNPVSTAKISLNDISPSKPAQFPMAYAQAIGH